MKLDKNTMISQDKWVTIKGDNLKEGKNDFKIMKKSPLLMM